jgi:hypothetical protein
LFAEKTAVCRSSHNASFTTATSTTTACCCCCYCGCVFETIDDVPSVQLFPARMALAAAVKGRYARLCKTVSKRQSVHGSLEWRGQTDRYACPTAANGCVVFGCSSVFPSNHTVTVRRSTVFLSFRSRLAPTIRPLGTALAGRSTDRPAGNISSPRSEQTWP